MKKPTKILLLVAGGWISFMNQGRGLQAALRSIGVKTELLFAGTKPSDTTHTPDLTPYHNHLVIAVGSWQDYGRLIAPALKAGCKVLPWIVSDAEVHRDVVAKLNALPWFLTTSEYCRTIFIRDGVKPERIRVLYEAIDEYQWKPQSATRQERFLDYLSIDEDNQVAMPMSFNLRKAKAGGTPILLTVGGDATSKGAIEIIKALHKLNPTLPWIWIVKTLPYEYSFTCSAKEYASLGELTPRVKYIIGEFSPKFLVDLMNLCDIYVAVSRGEGFGLPLAEAQMCGKMVITHDTTSTREIIVEGKTGLLARSHTIASGDEKGSARADIDSLAKQLHLALTERKLRQQLSRHARPTAVERFGKKAIAQQLMIYVKEFLA